MADPYARLPKVKCGRQTHASRLDSHMGEPTARLVLQHQPGFFIVGITVLPLPPG